jgi:hypothetical protein
MGEADTEEGSLRETGAVLVQWESSRRRTRIMEDSSPPPLDSVLLWKRTEPLGCCGRVRLGQALLTKLLRILLRPQTSQMLF